MIGRATELEAVTTTLGRARAGEGAAVLVVGEAGIGKTSLLSAARTRATGMHVAEARMSEPEAAIAYAGLSAIASAIPGAMAGVSEEARSVLWGVLGLGPPRMADPLAVAGAVLALLSAAAAERPLCVIVDDAQWLDPETAMALMLCARRIAHDPILILAAGRSPAIEASPLMASFAPIPVAGLTDEQARALLQEARLDLAPPVAEAILATARGNPLALTEIPRALSAAERNGSAPLPDPLPSGPHLEPLYAARAAGLSTDARTGLLILAASADEDPALILQAMPDPAALDEARQAGLLAPEGLAFRHPLVRSGVYGAADPAARREAHRLLAQVLGDDPPARARHLAAAQLEADEQIAAELEAAGMLAMARLGTSSAIGLLTRSAELSVTSEARVGRLTTAAQAAFMGGAFPTTLELLGAALAEGPPRVLQARIEHLRGQVRIWTGSLGDAVAVLVDGARAIETADRPQATAMLLDAAFAAGLRADVRGAQAIGAEAERISAGSGEVLEALARFVAHYLNSFSRRTGFEATLAEADRLDGLVDIDSPLAHWLGVVAHFRVWGDDPRRGIRFASGLAERYRAKGMAVASVYPEVLVGSGLVLSGDLDGARARLDTAGRLAEEIGVAPQLSLSQLWRSYVSAHQGHPDVDELTHRAVDVAMTVQLRSTETFAAHVRGLARLALGRPEEAVAEMEGLPQLLWDEFGMENPGILPFAPDLIEALLAVGRIDRAARLASGLVARTPETEAPQMALLLRCEGMLAAGAGEARERFVAAIETGSDIGRPIDLARTRLAYGRRLAADGQVTEARRVLQEAADGFAECGAHAWTTQSRRALEAVGGTAGTAGLPQEGLSPQELRVALLVADGLSNREIADRLFLTRRTIEFHLTNTYRKLGVRGRTALAAAMTRRATTDAR